MTDGFKFDTSLLCRASFPAELEDDGGRCIVEVTVYRLNAVAVHTFLLCRAPPKWRHYALHAKRARVRKKYRNRIRRAFFAALASEGGGSS